MLEGEHSLKMSDPQLLRFGIYSVLKILNERMTQSVNESVIYKGVYRTAPATLGLLTTWGSPVDGRPFPMPLQKYAKFTYLGKLL